MNVGVIWLLFWKKEMRLLIGGFNFRWLVRFCFGCLLCVTELVFFKVKWLGNAKEIRHQRN